MEQLTDRHYRVVRRDGAMPVHGTVSERIDHPRFAEDRLAPRLLEARLVNQRREVVLVGELQGCVMLVDPRHRQLQRTPGVEAGSARIGVYRGFRPGCCLEHRRPFAQEEGEVAHASEFPSECAVLE